MTKIKLVVIDLDRTLLIGPRFLPRKNAAAIRKLSASGIRIMLASGRDPERISSVIRKIKIPNPTNILVAGFQGAIIYDYDSKKIIHQEYISISDGLFITNLVNKYMLPMWAYAANDNKTNYTGDYWHPWIRFMQWEKGRKPVRYDVNQPLKMCKFLIGGHQSLIKHFRKELTAYKPFSIFTFYWLNKNKKFLEISPVGVNKQKAVQWAMNHLKINSSEIMAIGDGNNDVEMLKYVGLGVAVGNAVPELKAVANYVTRKNYQSGVATAIEKFIFNN